MRLLFTLLAAFLVAPAMAEEFKIDVPGEPQYDAQLSDQENLDAFNEWVGSLQIYTSAPENAVFSLTPYPRIEGASTTVEIRKPIVVDEAAEAYVFEDAPAAGSAQGWDYGLTLDATTTGTYLVIWVDDGEIGYERIEVDGENPPPPPPGRVSKIFAVEESGERALWQGILYSDRELIGYAGFSGRFSVVDKDVKNQHGDVPSSLVAVLEAAGTDLPAIVGLDDQGAVVWSKPHPQSAEEILAILPAPTRLLSPIQGRARDAAAEGIPEGIEWGVEPLTPELRASLAPLRAGAGMYDIPRDQWPVKISRRHLAGAIHDQYDGMCTSYASSSMVESGRSFQGQPNEMTCPPSLYVRHSPWGQGSTLWENLQCLLVSGDDGLGVCDRVTIPHNSNSYRQSTWPSDWKDNAELYRVLEYDWLTGFDQVAAAVCLGFPTNIGIRWPGGGGHSVHVCGLEQRNGVWYMEIKNSWGTDYGDRGYVFLSESQISPSLSNYGAFSIRSTVYVEDPEPSLSLAP